MKRHKTDPVMMIHRWNRPPLSCRRCRLKKRRCDRGQPCSNCSRKNVLCEYPQTRPSPDMAGAENCRSSVSGSMPVSPLLNTNEVLARLSHLEEAVFERSNQSSHHPGVQAIPTAAFTPFGLHLLSPPADETPIDTSYVISQLPPLLQARELFNHFSSTLQPAFGVLHIPSTYKLLEQTYQHMVSGKELDIASILLLLSIFAASANAWTAKLLEILNATPAEARSAFTAYYRLAMSILDNPQPVPPSTTALTAISTLAHVTLDSSGSPEKILTIRFRCLVMARVMQIPSLDTAKSCEERRVKGCNMIEVEVQRRIWWNMVASDWVMSYHSSPHEGAYIFHPQHMKVNFPSNVDDGLITPTDVPPDLPFHIPTSMTGFLQRMKMAELCREVVDAMPLVLLESQQPDYEVVMRLDRKFQNYLDELPFFFRLDPASIQQSEEICKQRPYIAWQRISTHFALHTRLCRLHRPYHLEGATDPKYSYSHRVCIRSAQTVLELRRAMDDAGMEVGQKPTKRFLTVMQHVFLAALILATDVSFNPHAPDAEARKAKVLGAYQILEKSKEESKTFTESIQRNLQTLMSTLQKKRTQVVADSEQEYLRQPTEPRNNSVSDYTVNDERGLNAQHAQAVEDPLLGGESSMAVDAQNSWGHAFDQDNWEQLWSEFLNVAPDLNVPQWSSLLDDVNVDFDANIY